MKKRLALRNASLAALALFALVVVGVRRSEASPVTLLYTGSVLSTFDGTLLPGGSPVTTLITFDNADNVWAGNLGCGPHPEGGGYLVDALITLNGQQYNYSIALEVNYDFTFCHDNSGHIRIVPFGLSGPALGPYFPGNQGNQGGAYFAGSTDPNSPDFPSSSNLFLDLRFSLFEPADVLISANNPQVVPEPTTLLLFGTGFAAAAARRRFRAPC
jgi:PEP-CTERM motif